MRIGEIARVAGVSPDTIRHYERRGLLPRIPRSSSGYRQFGNDAVRRVKIARAALSIGFTIDELSKVFLERDRGGAPCARVRELAGDKLRVLDRYLSELELLRKQLQNTLRDWDKSLRGTKPGHRAGLLEQFAEKNPRSVLTFSPYLAPRLQASRRLKGIMAQLEVSR